MPRHKRRGKGAPSGKFVMLAHWLLHTQAWRSLSHGPRALYVEIRHRFNGANNGKVTLSHREAALALNVHRNTVGSWFHELEARGFITPMRGHTLGPSGVGETTLWALDEEALDGMPPAKKFARWQAPEKQQPRTKNRMPRHKKQDSETATDAKSAAKPPASSAPVLKIVPLGR